MNVQYHVEIMTGTLVYVARDSLAKKAIRDGYTHTLWLDSDMVFEPDLMQALDPEHCVNARVSYGGPSYVENDRQLEKGGEILKEQEEKLKELLEKI